MPVSNRLTASRLVKTSFAFALTAIAFSNTPLLEAASLYWDSDATGAGNAAVAGTGLGGTGNWNNSLSGAPLTNWWNGASATDQAWVNATNDTAIFSGTAGTVSLTDNVNVGGLVFNTTGYTLNTGANTLTFAGGSLINLNNVAAATITGAVTGSGAVTISRSLTGASAGSSLGLVNFNGTSAGGWSGATTISNGATASLSVGNQALLNTSSIALGGSITLTNIAGQAALNRISDTAAITSTGGVITYANTATASTAYTETIGSVGLTSGALNVVLSNNQNATTNTQTLTLSGLTRTGNTSAVSFSAAGTGPNATTNRINVTGATATTAGQIIGPWATIGTAANAQTDYAVYDSAGNIVGANIAASSETTWTTPASAYTVTGGSTLTATRSVAALRATGAAQAIALNSFNLETNGILNAGTGTLTISGTGNIRQQGTAAGTLFINAGSAGGAVSISSIIANNTGALSLVKTGAGTLNLSGVNTYTGTTTVLEGTLTPTSASVFNGDIIVGSLGGGAAAVFGANNINVNLKSDNSVNVTVYSNGTFGWANSQSGHVRNLTVIGGTVNTGFGYVDGTITMTGGNITGSMVGSSSVVNTNASDTTAVITNLGTAGSIVATVANGAAAIDLQVNSGPTYQFGSLTKNGLGVMALGTTSYAGSTTVNAGTLLLRSTTSLQNTPLTNGGTGIVFDSSVVSNAFTFGGLNGAGALALQNNASTLDAVALTLKTATGTTRSYSGVLSGAGSIIKSGAGTQTLTGVSTYTGATTVSEGLLNLGVANAISASSGVVLSGGTIQSGFTQTLGTLNLSASSTINLTGSGKFAFADSSALAWTGTLSITGTFSDNTSIRFGTDANGLTSDQLSQILINGGAASLDASGYLFASAIPEPSTYAAIFGALALAGAAWKRRTARAARAVRA